MSTDGASGRPDVLVVGAGPAGSTLAALLADRWDVVVVDRARFPRAKACGECVNPGAVAALERLGVLAELLERSPARLSGWELRTGGGRSARGWFAPSAGPALGIPRKELDHTLLRHAVRAGATVCQGVRVTDVTLDGGIPEVTAVMDGAARRWRPRVLVGADGLRSVVARRLGVVRRRPRLRKASLTCRLRGGGPPRDRGSLTVHDGFVCGIAPVHGREPVWNCTVVAHAGTPSRALASDPVGAVTRLARESMAWTDEPRVVEGPWASGPFDWPMRRPRGVPVLLVGDAAGYYDPFTGQGIYRALRSAELAAPAISRHLGGGDEGAYSLPGAARAIQVEFGAGRALQRVIELVLSRRSTRELATAALGLFPGGLDALIHVTGDVRPVRTLASPSAWLGSGGRGSGAAPSATGDVAASSGRATLNTGSPMSGGGTGPC